MTLVLFTAAAERQFRELSEWYLDRSFLEAAVALDAALATAIDRIGADSTGILPPQRAIRAPRPFPELASMSLLWIEQGAYWFGFYRDAEKAVVTNILKSTADIARRASAERTPSGL